MSNCLKEIMLLCLIVLWACDDLPKGVTKNKIDLRQKKSFSSEKLSRITGITQSKCFDLDNNYVGIFDLENFFIFDPIRNKIISKVDINWEFGSLRPILVAEKENEDCYFISSGRSDSHEIKTVDKQNSWEVGREKVFNYSKMIIADLNEDKNSELYVASKERIYSYSLKGELKWNKSLNNADLGIFLIDDSKFLLVLNDDADIELLNYEGKIVKKYHLRIKVNNIESIYLNGDYYYASYIGNRLYIFNNKWEEIYSHSFPYEIFRCRGTSIEWGGVGYLAIISDFSVSVGKSALCIVSYTGDLGYLEVIGSTLGIGKFNDIKNNNSYLLCGDGIGQIKIYEKGVQE